MRLTSFGLVMLLGSVAHAQVTLPDGTVVPRDPSAAGEQRLDAFFAERLEAIDWILDASSEPDTFSPLCDFTASVVLNEAGLSLGVGWYNVIPDATVAPTAAEIYEIVPAGSGVGTTVTGASIREDARYLGGEIGFALIRTPPHFTESKWNTLCDSGACASTPGHWILSLSYRSTLVENAWYVGFEDGDTTSSSWNNDGDYNDMVFFFTGIVCSGGGEPCTVEGASGLCANGLTECVRGGEIECRQVTEPAAETCDAVDNDCDGTVDEGGDLCATREVCLRGSCVTACDVEFGCLDPADTCDDGFCVDPACVGVDCAEGLTCTDGDCVSACDGVVCPGDEVCRGGACVDPCLGVSCDDGRVCERGVCVEGCICQGCAEGLECARDGRCVDEGCAGLTCSEAEVCTDGACVDGCDGVVCPDGQRCEAASCIEIPPPVAMDAGPIERDAGGAPPATDAGVAPVTDAGVDVGMDAATEGDGGTDVVGGGPGCGCRTVGAHRSSSLGALLLLALLWGGRRRRRRAAHSSHAL